MYLELYRTLGDATFRKAWGTYYTYLADEALYVRCLNEPKGCATPTPHSWKACPSMPPSPGRSSTGTTMVYSGVRKTWN